MSTSRAHSGCIPAQAGRAARREGGALSAWPHCRSHRSEHGQPCVRGIHCAQAQQTCSAVGQSIHYRLPRHRGYRACAPSLGYDGGCLAAVGSWGGPSPADTREPEPPAQCPKPASDTARFPARGHAAACVPCESQQVLTVPAPSGRCTGCRRRRTRSWPAAGAQPGQRLRAPAPGCALGVCAGFDNRVATAVAP